jgi:hypothetical protein
VIGCYGVLVSTGGSGVRGWPAGARLLGRRLERVSRGVAEQLAESVELTVGEPLPRLAMIRRSPEARPWGTEAVEGAARESICMDKVFKLLTEALFRLKELPGLGFLNTYYVRVRDVHLKITKKIRDFKTQRDNLKHKVKQVKEIPTLVKGSKKKSS